MEALHGSCLQIPCSFSPIPEQNFDSEIGGWLKNYSKFTKNQNFVIFNSSRPNNAFPMKITGKPTEKNCTTLFSDLLTSYTNK